MTSLDAETTVRGLRGRLSDVCTSSPAADVAQNSYFVDTLM